MKKEKTTIISETSPVLPEKIKILIIDDAAAIRRLLQGILSDEGFAADTAEDAASAIKYLAQNSPALILLDIWMPGMDGLEMLGKVKKLYPQIPVIMISGHASIATAVKATRLGAVDFIEKPLDLNTTLNAVKKALRAAGEGKAAQLDIPPDTVSGLGTRWSAETLLREPFMSQAWKGRALQQKTLVNTAVLYGQGLHSGKKSGLILEPLPANSGIHFVGVTGKDVVPAYLDYVDSTGFATTLKRGDTVAATIEHLLAALHAYGISNLMVKCNVEIPVMDGSALEFCKLFDEIGMTGQEGEWFEIAIGKKIKVGGEKEFIQIEPADNFSIDFTLEYPEPIGRQRRIFELDGPESFRKEIAPARTFGFVKDIDYLQKKGLAQGGRFDNFVLIGEDGVINGALRFPDEPVRHKILDAIGDLYLLGRRIRGKVTASMTGHSDNIALLKALKSEAGM